MQTERLRYIGCRRDVCGTGWAPSPGLAEGQAGLSPKVTGETPVLPLPRRGEAKGPLLVFTA